MTHQKTIKAPPGLAEMIVGIRRRLHQYPETGFQESRTASIIIEELKKLGIPYSEKIAKTGICADIHGGEDGPTVAIRADMDGLPLEEATGLKFASKNPGMMHACGHDGHMAMLLGIAAVLKEEKFPGRVRLIFQPAEEGGGGAALMVEEGVLDGVDCIIGGHLDRHYEAGEIIAADGLICAYTDEFTIEIRGNGGHAARPHETADPIVTAGLLIMNLQTLVSREINPSWPCVVSVGQINGGTAANVIADRTTMRGTIRATHPESREKLLKGIKRMTGAMADLFSVRVEITIKEGYPPVVNDPATAAVIRDMIRENQQEYRLRELEYPSLGGEDFSFYQKKVPGCFLRIGARPTHQVPAPSHSPNFDFNEEALTPGALLFARATLALIAVHSRPSR